MIMLTCSSLCTSLHIIANESLAVLQWQGFLPGNGELDLHRENVSVRITRVRPRKYAAVVPDLMAIYHFRGQAKATTINSVPMMPNAIPPYVASVLRT